MVGLQALSLALGVGTVTAPTLYRLPGLPPMLRSLYAAAADMAPVADLPWSAAEPNVRFPVEGHAIDLRDFAFDPDFGRLSMLDFFLDRLGVDAARVPAEARRNTWLAPRLPGLPEWVPDGPVLVCPRASMPLREMPDAAREAVVAHLARRKIPFATHEGDAPDVAALAARVRRSRLLVSTDTAMVHLADALSVPCLAFFPTHDPALRVRDYPLCRPVRLAADLPPNLEFARSPSDVAAARAAWFRPGLDWLAPVLDAALDF